MTIDPNNLAATATQTFDEDFNSFDLWNGTTGTAKAASKANVPAHHFLPRGVINHRFDIVPPLPFGKPGWPSWLTNPR